MQGVPTTLRDVVEGALNHLKRKAAGLPVDGGCIYERKTTPINKRGSQWGRRRGQGWMVKPMLPLPPPLPLLFCVRCRVLMCELHDGGDEGLQTM